MYEVITATTIEKLCSNVSSKLNKGWLLAGGVTTQIYQTGAQTSPYDVRSVVPNSTNNHVIHYLQAIYKPQPKELL